MPLTPYFRPQSTITQILRSTPAPEADRTNPLVIGVQYKLMLADGRDLPELGFLSAGAGSLPYQDENGIALDLQLHTPHAASARLYGKDLMGLATSAPIAGALADVVDFSSSKIRITTDNLADYSGSPAMNSSLKGGRNVQVGDYVRVAVNFATGVDETVIRKVTSLLPRMSAASASATLLLSTDGSVVANTTVSGTYTGAVNTRYIFEYVSSSGGDTVHTFRVWDSAGIEAATNVSITEATPAVIGTKGLSVNLAAPYTKPAVGTRYYIDAVAAAPIANKYNGVVVDAPIGDGVRTVSDVTVDVLVPFTGFLTPAGNTASGSGTVVTAGASTWAYSGSLGILYAPGVDFAFVNGLGTVSLSYKAAVIPSATEGPIAITSASQLVSALGETSLENHLARGTFEAFNGNQGRLTYALRVADDTEAAYATALNKVRTTDVFYALVPLTDSLDVMQLVIAHCEEMSNKYHRNFRRCYVGTDSPGEYTIWGQLPDTSYRTASLTGRTVTLSAEFRASSKFSVDAAVGDKIKFNTYDVAHEIVAILSDYEVLLATTAQDLTLPASAFSLVRADTPANTAKFLQTRAAALNSRRCVNVWSDYATTSLDDGTLAVVPNKFIAAEVAGIRCALLPQQGLTMTEITSVSDAPSMYTTFTPEILDTIAAAGTLIVTQESLNGDMFIRHQLTTDVSNGALAYEDNVGVIVDMFSYDEKDRFRNYIGKRNVTQQTIADIRTELLNLAFDYTQVDAANAEYGPMVIRFFNEAGEEGAVTVRVDSQLADRIVTYVKLRVPLPLNGLDHFVDVETSVEL